jgi:hypothetical protein
MAVYGILEAAGNTSRVHHKPAASLRTPAGKLSKSKPTERGAGSSRLRTCKEYTIKPYRDQVSRRCWWGAIAPGQLTWVERSVEGVTWHHNGGVVQQEVVVLSTKYKEHEEQAEGEPSSVPRRLDERHRALLAATHVDWECEAVDMLKCRICPVRTSATGKTSSATAARRRRTPLKSPTAIIVGISLHAGIC